MNKKLIIFVCTGNTCRSPMAEALFKNGLTDEENELFEVKSYGLAVLGADAASKYAIDVMAKKGLDITAHRSAPLNLYIADNAYLIVAMTDSHRNALVRAGINGEKIITLNVGDPYGGTLDDYRQCANEIELKLEAVYARIR